MAKPLQKDRDNRSADKKDLTFHAFNITPESAHTSILLLESTEPEILCQVGELLFACDHQYLLVFWFECKVGPGKVTGMLECF